MSRLLFTGLLDALAKVVGAGLNKHVVLLRDNAAFHKPTDLAVHDGLRPVGAAMWTRPIISQ